MNQVSQIIMEDVRLVRNYFLAINLCWLLLIPFLTFTCLEVVSRSICSIAFPGIEVRLTSLLFLLPLSWRWEWFIFSLSLQEHHHSLQKITESVLGMLSASSQGTCGMHPMKLYLSNLYKYFLTWSSSSKLSLPWTFLGFSEVLGFLKAGLTSKEWSREGTEYLSLSHILYHQVTCLIQQ